MHREMIAMPRLWNSFLKAFLSTTLVLCFLPTMAFANQEDTSTQYDARSLGTMHVVEVFDDFSDFEASLDLASYGDILSIADAEDAVREQMIGRTGTIKVAVRVNSVDDAQGFAQEFMEDVLAETDDPRGGDYLRFHVKKWSSSIAYYTGGTTYWIALTVTYNTTAAQEQQVDTRVASLISELGISGMTDYQKAKVLHDWMCLNVNYDHQHEGDSSYRAKYTTYGALIEGSAVCQGYATLYYRLCREAGLNVRVIPGTGTLSGESVTHAWNIVELKGFYYNVDTTWDENLTTGSTPNRTYFLKSNSNFAGHVRNSDYTTSSFNSAYPMASASYVDGRLSITNATASLSKTTYTYSGSAAKPSVTVKHGTATLVKGTDYTVSYSNNTNVGTGKVTVTGIGEYSGTISLTFTINPVIPTISAVAAVNNGFTVKWNRVSTQCNGYEIRYSTSSSLSGATTKKIASATVTSNSITNIKDRTTYYVQMRTYKTVDGKTYYSSWSSSRKVTTK